LATRELEPDPNYQSNFRPPPATSLLAVDVTPDDEALLQGLVDTGVYGETRAEAIRAAFMRWSNQHITRIRRPYVQFADAGG
jgi:hypothetical protein